MEDIAGLILDALAARGKARAGGPPRSPAPPPPVPGPVAGARAVAVPTAGAVARAAAQSASTPARLAGVSQAPAARARKLPPLLAAFAEPSPFLSAFVLSEALAPPIALRPPKG